MKYIMIMVLALGLSACGQTVQGVGKDIMELGQSVVDMGTPDTTKPTKVEKSE